MTSGRFTINGKQVLTMDENKEMKHLAKEVKKVLIQISSMYDIDYDNDSIALEYDLGEGYHATYYKGKNLGA